MVKKLFFIATLLYIGATASAENYQVKSPDGKIVAELSTGQMIEDVKLATRTHCPKPVYFYGRTGGNIFAVDELSGEIDNILSGWEEQ